MKKARIIVILCAVCFSFSQLQALANTASHQIILSVRPYSYVSMQDDSLISVALDDGRPRTAQVQRHLRYGGVASSTSGRSISVQLAGSGTQSVPAGLSVSLSLGVDSRQRDRDPDEITLSSIGRTLMAGLGNNNASTGRGILLSYTIHVANERQLHTETAEVASVVFTLTDL